MEDAKVKKILSCIEEGGGYSIEHLSTFKKLYPVVIDYFHSRNSRNQIRSDVVKILSLSKLNDMYIADAKFFNRTTNKSSKRKISLMLNDTKILALLKDYEYMLKRSLRYVNDLYKELKKRNISLVDFSMESKGDYIDDLFSFVKNKELKLSDLDEDYENIAKYYSFQDVIDVKSEKKVEFTNQADSEVQTLESANNCSFEEPSDSVDKKVTFSSRNEIIDIPVYAANKLDSVNKHKRKKITEKEAINKMELKGLNNKLNTLTAFNEVYIKKKKPQTEKKDIKYASSLNVAGEKKNNPNNNANKVLNQVDMSNYVDMMGFNDHNNLIADINQLYDEPYKDLNDFENMVNASELLKNLRDDDFMLTFNEERKKLGSDNLNHTDADIINNSIPEKNEQVTAINYEVKDKFFDPSPVDNKLKEDKSELDIFEDKNLENKSLDSCTFIGIKEREYTSKKNHVSVNQEEDENFDFILFDGKSKENEEQQNIVEDKGVENKYSDIHLYEGETVINRSPENAMIKSNLFDTSIFDNEKNLGLIEDIFIESKMNEELEKKQLETRDQNVSVYKESRQIKENITYDDNNRIKNERVTKNDDFRDKDILKINRKKEDKKIDVSFLLSKTRYKKM